MKNILSALFFFVVFICFQSCRNQKELELNVMTFNIRYDNPDDGLNNWKYRKDVVCKVIKNYDIDVLGTQEVLKNQLEDMKSSLPEYNAIGVGRENGIDKGEYSALFYKKEKFSITDSGTFWLSETPDIAGSKGWDGACERIATWAILEDIITHKKVFVINTHLDHVGKQARVKGIKLILEKSSQLSENLPIVFMGDLNSTPDSEIIKLITDKELSGNLINTKDHAISIADKEWTFHDFGNLPEAWRSYIDYIFVSKETDVLEYKVADEKLENIYLSDHMPVYAKIKIK